MVTDEQHSTSGKGVPHTRHTVRGCCRLIPKPWVINIQRVQPACDASVCAAYSDGSGCVRSVDLALPSCLRAVHCGVPCTPTQVVPHTTGSPGHRNLR